MRIPQPRSRYELLYFTERAGGLYLETDWKSKGHKDCELVVAR